MGTYTAALRDRMQGASIASQHAKAMSTQNDAPEPPVPRKATLAEIISAVLWGYFGVRRGARLEQDAVSIRPHQIIIAGVIIAAILVVALIVIVRVVVAASGG